jgi:hypothetical protein
LKKIRWIKWDVFREIVVSARLENYTQRHTVYAASGIYEEDKWSEERIFFIKQADNNLIYNFIKLDLGADPCEEGRKVSNYIFSYCVRRCCLRWCKVLIARIVFTRTSVISTRKVWFQHAQCDFCTECYFLLFIYTQI